MKKFLKKSEVKLVNGGYLSNVDNSPVINDAFVKAQQHAEYIITFAKLAKDKDFIGKKADSLSELSKQVKEELAKKDVKYVETPKKVVKKLSNQLADEAMAFMNFEKETSKADKINLFLQQFNVLHEFEEFGLFFEEGIVKLNKIYTMSEIVESVKETIDLLK